MWGYVNILDTRLLQNWKLVKRTAKPSCKITKFINLLTYKYVYNNNSIFMYKYIICFLYIILMSTDLVYYFGLLTCIIQLKFMQFFLIHIHKYYLSKDYLLATEFLAFFHFYLVCLEILHFCFAVVFPRYKQSIKKITRRPIYKFYTFLPSFSSFASLSSAAPCCCCCCCSTFCRCCCWCYFYIYFYFYAVLSVVVFCSSWAPFCVGFVGERGGVCGRGKWALCQKLK